MVQLPEKIVNVPGEHDFVKIKMLDLTSNFEVEPTEDELRSAAERYIQNNEIGVPVVSLDVTFAQLQKSEEYKHLKLLERVSLFDTVRVEFPALRVSAKAKAVKIIYNVLLDRVESVTLGSVRANIADTIVEQQKQIQEVPSKTDLQLAREAATAWLTNGKGYKVERRDANGNVIDTLYMDTPNIDEAVDVLRIGNSGIGFSHNGVNGPYADAWTIDGQFNADFITAGSINASLIKSGSMLANVIKAGQMTSVDGKMVVDLDSSTISSSVLDQDGHTYVLRIDKGGIMVYDPTSGRLIFDMSFSGYGHINEPFMSIQSNVKMTISGSPLSLGTVNPVEIYGKEARWEVMNGRNVLVAD
jgi:phage-related protein